MDAVPSDLRNSVKIADGSEVSGGERVRVVAGALAGQEGTVERALTIPLLGDPYEVVWVRLPARVEGFKPESMVLAG